MLAIELRREMHQNELRPAEEGAPSKGKRYRQRDQLPVNTTDTYSHENPYLYEATVPEKAWRQDAKGLRVGELKRRYPLTFNSFQSTVFGRGKGPGGEVKGLIHPDVQSFPGFLLHFGPRRRPELTLDRLDHNNPYYGPGLCAWRDKRDQARNRRSTIMARHPDTGALVPLIALADEWNADPQRLRRWHRQGWSTTKMRLALFNGAHRRQELPDQWPWILDEQRLKAWEDRYEALRLLSDEHCFENRPEFAVRWLSMFIRDRNGRQLKIWEDHIAPELGSGATTDDLPKAIAKEFSEWERQEVFAQDLLEDAAAAVAKIKTLRGGRTGQASDVVL